MESDYRTHVSRKTADAFLLSSLEAGMSDDPLMMQVLGALARVSGLTFPELMRQLPTASETSVFEALSRAMRLKYARQPSDRYFITNSGRAQLGSATAIAS